MKNKPLFERYTTVTGKQVKNPGTFLVRMGTPFSQMIENCGGLPEGDNHLLFRSRSASTTLILFNFAMIEPFCLVQKYLK